LAVGWLWIALLALAVVVLVAAEWPRLAGRAGLNGLRMRPRPRPRRRSHLRVIEPEGDPDSDEFAASVERDLAQLPTTKERDLN
jgi:hypothetical protein